MASVDAAGTVAGWLSFFVTAVGLGSLVTQANAIEERLDPFRHARSAEYLGSWISRQPPKPRLWLGRPPPPEGPVVTASLVKGFCGSNIVYLSRLPLEKTGSASWTTLLAIFHEGPTPVLPGPEPLRTNTWRRHTDHQETEDAIEARRPEILEVEKGQLRTSPSWTSLSVKPLIREGSASCILISSITLIIMLSVCNGVEAYRYSDASGHRAAYNSYCGSWYINWPLGQEAVVSLAPLRSHSLSTDLYPRTFVRRVDTCIRMTAGVITSPDGKSFQCGFSVRKPPGQWILQYQRRGFPGARGSRHLYYLVGGKNSEVDFLFARKLEADPPSSCLRLVLPSQEKNEPLVLFVPTEEQKVLDHALDCLPWSSLPWSLHRGLRDILLGYAQSTINKYRKALASQLRNAVAENQQRLQNLGWAGEFVIDGMADVAFHSVMAGEGNSGDVVRVVTDVALLFCPSTTLLDLDETTFWRQERYQMGTDLLLSPNAIIALTKFFVLEWSYEFDYQMYHDLPPELLMK